MKITSYRWSTHPQELLDLTEELTSDDTLIAAAGFDPQDPEVEVLWLKEPWKTHPAGAALVTGCTTEGHPFAIIEGYEMPDLWDRGHKHG